MEQTSDLFKRNKMVWNTDGWGLTAAHCDFFYLWHHTHHTRVLKEKRAWFSKTMRPCAIDWQIWLACQATVCWWPSVRPSPRSGVANVCANRQNAPLLPWGCIGRKIAKISFLSKLKIKNSILSKRPWLMFVLFTSTRWWITFCLENKF